MTQAPLLLEGEPCPFKRCQEQAIHCDGACHGVKPDGTPLEELPPLAEDIVDFQPIGGWYPTARRYGIIR